ncbi:hypothetical protein COCON_G00033130 [Conger conger]|uniref:Uncharacterized protein n=1 Tax=Conger conger TaxID=82655 RepID=A0A9Q1DZ47_CONCO|nr:hypothetical protein COCON_G00033130 [Conger conger]
MHCNTGGALSSELSSLKISRKCLSAVVGSASRVCPADTSEHNVSRIQSSSGESHAVPPRSLSAESVTSPPSAHLVVGHILLCHAYHSWCSRASSHCQAHMDMMPAGGGL